MWKKEKMLFSFTTKIFNGFFLRVVKTNDKGLKTFILEVFVDNYLNMPTKTKLFFDLKENNQNILLTNIFNFSHEILDCSKLKALSKVNSTMEMSS